MTWLAIGSFVGSGLKSVLKWLGSLTFWQLACLALACIAVVQHFTLADARHDAAKWQAQFNSERAARLADRKSYEQAQQTAAAENKAHVAAVEQEQQRITDERLKDANDRLARLAGELRAHGPAAQSHASNAGSSEVRDPASGADGEAGLCISADQLLRAAQDEERHDQLITWIEQQLAVDPNK